MPGKANTINHKEENTGMEIKGKVHYVGVNDRNKTLFENLWPLPYGVSYNSYLIDDEMVALVDTVDVCYFEVYLKKIRSIIGDRPINYLIINHMEPDHSGSINRSICAFSCCAERFFLEISFCIPFCFFLRLAKSV